MRDTLNREEIKTALFELEYLPFLREQDSIPQTCLDEVDKAQNLLNSLCLLLSLNGINIAVKKDSFRSLIYMLMTKITANVDEFAFQS